MRSISITSLLAATGVTVVTMSSVATAQIRETDAAVTALAVQCAVSSGYSMASYSNYAEYARSLAKTLGMLSSGQQVNVFGYLPTPSGGSFVDASKPTSPPVAPPDNKDVDEAPSAPPVSSPGSSPTPNGDSDSEGNGTPKGGDVAGSPDLTLGYGSPSRKDGTSNPGGSSAGSTVKSSSDAPIEESPSITSTAQAGSEGKNSSVEASAANENNRNKRPLGDYRSLEEAYRSGYSWQEIQAWLKSLDEEFKSRVPR